MGWENSLGHGSRTGAGGTECSRKETLSVPLMLPFSHEPSNPSGHAEVGTTVPPSCLGVLAAQPYPFALQNLLCPSLPSCRLHNFFTAQGGRERQKRETCPSVFNAPVAGAGQCRGLQVSPLWWGKESTWEQVRGRAGAVTPAEGAGPAQHLVLLPLGKAWSSLPSREA